MSEELGEILSRATLTQVRWVMERLTSRSDAEAAARVGLARSTVCEWENKAELDRAVNLLLQDATLAARAVMEQAAIEAAGVLRECLSDPDPRVRLGAAIAILDRIGLKPTDRRPEPGRKRLVVKLRVRDEPKPAPAIADRVAS